MHFVNYVRPQRHQGRRKLKCEGPDIEGLRQEGSEGFTFEVIDGEKVLK